MSPFTQLTDLAGRGGSSIDRNFSPLLSYIDEFDRHFSRRHRFMNCYIPRFDLAESPTHYYLSGDLPGAQISDIDVTVRDEHTLIIEGKTEHTDFIEDTVHGNANEEGEFRNGEYHKVTEKDLEGEAARGEVRGDEIAPAAQQPQNPTVQGQGQGHPHHQRYPTSGPADTKTSDPNPQSREPHLQILLSERLTGPFHREFAFPSAVVEGEVRAAMENGVLTVVVPKRRGAREEKKGRRVEVQRGGGRREGHLFGSASGAV